MKELNLGKDKINKLILSFSIPCVISMLINSIYNIVDQIFIGKGVGTLGNAATNVIFPLIIIFNAVAGLIGNGAAANLSLKLGEKNKKAAEEKIKSLNEAYEVLSNPQKKQAYDAKLERLKKEEEQRKQVEQQRYVNNISNVYARQYENAQRDAEKNRVINKQFKKEYKRELRRLRIEGFIRKIVAIVSVIAVLALICFIIYIIPATNRWLHNLYENNVIIKAIVDAIS